MYRPTSATGEEPGEAFANLEHGLPHVPSRGGCPSFQAHRYAYRTATAYAQYSRVASQQGHCTPTAGIPTEAQPTILFENSFT